LQSAEDKFSAKLNEVDAQLQSVANGGTPLSTNAAGREFSSHERAVEPRSILRRSPAWKGIASMMVREIPTGHRPPVTGH
jgi:hypothetical protein